MTDKLITNHPRVKSFYGGYVFLTVADIATIEDLVSVGAGLEMVATQLNLDLSDFKRVGKVSVCIQEAVKRGRAKDRWEYDQALRNASLSMKSPILSIWHGKQAFNMTDKVIASNANSSVIVVNTGIPQQQVADKPADNGIIEHE